MGGVGGGSLSELSMVLMMTVGGALALTFLTAIVAFALFDLVLRGVLNHLTLRAWRERTGRWLVAGDDPTRVSWSTLCMHPQRLAAQIANRFEEMADSRPQEALRLVERAMRIDPLRASAADADKGRRKREAADEDRRRLHMLIDCVVDDLLARLMWVNGVARYLVCGAAALAISGVARDSVATAAVTPAQTLLICLVSALMAAAALAFLDRPTPNR